METLKPFTISIVVPSFNQRAFVSQTLQSLVDQEDPALEIIVVDGGSTDGSAEEIRRFEKHIAWWVSEPDAGQSHALNKGFARARGEWLAWLNSDDLLFPAALGHLREHIARAASTQWWIGAGAFIDSRGRRTGAFRPPVGLAQPGQLADWRTFWFAQPSTFFSKFLFDAAGGRIREDLHYAMDLDLWIRLLKVRPPGFITQELSAYRIHSTAKTSMLTVPAEVEILRVIEGGLGREAMDARIRCIAADRLHFEQQFRSLERRLAPIARSYGAVKAALRRVTARSRRKGA